MYNTVLWNQYDVGPQRKPQSMFFKTVKMNWTHIELLYLSIKFCKIVNTKDCRQSKKYRLFNQKLNMWEYIIVL